MSISCVQSVGTILYKFSLYDIELVPHTRLFTAAIRVRPSDPGLVSIVPRKGGSNSYLLVVLWYPDPWSTQISIWILYIGLTFLRSVALRSCAILERKVNSAFLVLQSDESNQCAVGQYVNTLYRSTKYLYNFTENLL